MKPIFYFTGLICFFFLTPSPSLGAKKSSDIIKSEAGIRIPDYGITLDAFHTPELDRLISGYRILNVLIQNNQSQPILLSVDNDRWFVIDKNGRKHKAFNHVSHFKKSLWDKMSERLKSKIAYPAFIPPQKMVAIDLFFDDSVDLNEFKEVLWDSDYLQKKFAIFTPIDADTYIEFSHDKILDFPKKQTPTQINDSPSQPSAAELEYQKARDAFMKNESEKIFYIDPDGSVREESTKP